jgi:hypothetical protein
MGYVFARLIDKGLYTIDKVPSKYQAATKAAYKELFGIDL